jgi:hypothetical protein
MKLAEALALRAEATRRIDQPRARIVDNARYQEGEQPAEDAASLLTQTGHACAELESLIRRINRTNASAPLGTGTITDAIARGLRPMMWHGASASWTPKFSARTGRSTCWRNN